MTQQLEEEALAVEQPQGEALEEFTDGFRDGYRGAPRQKNRSGGYRSAYTKGAAARQEDEAWRKQS